MLLLLLGVLGANPAWHETLHEGIHEAASGSRDAAAPTPEDHDSSHPGDACAVCAYLHQQVGDVVDAPSVVAVFEIADVPGFLPPPAPVLAALRREPGSRGPPLWV